jgi:glutathione synthase/RimK-type ligase-like ATP-grasp enzyme
VKIACITYRGEPKYSAANGFNEVLDLLPLLQAKGLDIELCVWNDPAVDWARYAVALLRTPWDYHDNADAFRAWLTHLEGLGIRLLNDYAVVRWNLDKHYLREIEEQGYDVIPSRYLAPHTVPDFPALFAALATDQLIFKPCISGGSKNTLAVTRANYAGLQAEATRLLAQGSYLVQPFVPEIAAGEWSFIFFNGVFSHCILKTPRPGDFRVQQAYGGSIALLAPTAAQVAKAAAYLPQFGPGTLYARIDGMMQHGTFVLMELEFIEPFLYLAYAPAATENFCRALFSRLAEQAAGPVHVEAAS